MSTSARPPVTDSFVFWVYLFCTAGLAALALMGPKYQQRQLQLERQYQARMRAGELAASGQVRTPVSTAEDLLIQLRPLVLLLAAALALAWLRFWYVRVRGAVRSPVHRPVRERGRSPNTGNPEP